MFAVKVHYLTSSLFGNIADSRTTHGDIQFRLPKTLLFKAKMSINYRKLKLFEHCTL